LKRRRAFPSPEKLDAFAALAGDVGKIARRLRDLDLDLLREEIAFSREASERHLGVCPALDRLSAVRSHDSALILFIAEELAKVGLSKDETARLLREAEQFAGRGAR
jgi:hypothetical protein